MTLHKYVFIASVVAVGIYPICLYWKIYVLYQQARERVEKIGFFWFSFYVQSPSFGRGAQVLETLPPNLQSQATAIRGWQGKTSMGLVLWLIFLIVIGVVLNRL